MQESAGDQRKGRSKVTTHNTEIRSDRIRSEEVNRFSVSVHLSLLSLHFLTNCVLLRQTKLRHVSHESLV